MPEQGVETSVVRRRRDGVYFVGGVLVVCAGALTWAAIAGPRIDGETLTHGERVAAAVIAAGALATAILQAVVALRATLQIDERQLRQTLRGKVYVVPRDRVTSAATYVPPDGVTRLALLGTSGGPLAILRIQDWRGDVADLVAATWQINIPDHRHVNRHDMKQIYPAIDWPWTDFLRGGGGGGG